MSEPRIDEIVRELRATAPPAPQNVRERIRSLPEPEARRTFRIRLRPALAGAAAAAVLLGIGAAAINGLSNDSTPSERESLGSELGGSGRVSGTFEKHLGRRAPVGTALAPTGSRQDAAAVPPSTRVQNYDARLRLRVEDREVLSDAMKLAVLERRRLGGYGVAAQEAQAAQGDGPVVVRVPIARVQDAIASFSSLGTILEQRISLQDIQQAADRLTKSIATKKRRIAELEAKRARTRLTAAEQAELAAMTADLTRLTQRRAAVVRQGAYARVSLGLTTRKAAAPTKKDEPGAFGSFLDDAGRILALEAVAVLYALVVVGPFALLAAFALLGERARRRRANHA